MSSHSATAQPGHDADALDVVCVPPDVIGRAVVVGAGRVGRAYERVLDELGARPVLVDPVRSSLAALVRWSLPRLVVVATPPGAAMGLARRAAAAGAVVLVAHPGAVTAAEMQGFGAGSARRTFWAFEQHFESGVQGLLQERPQYASARVLLDCHRPPEFYRGWRASRRCGGGILHQQALPALAVISRLCGPNQAPPSLVSSALCPRPGLEVEAEVAGTCRLGRMELEVRARADMPAETPPRLRIELGAAGETTTTLTGAAWAAGLGAGEHVAVQHDLRGRLCAAAAQVAAGGAQHPSLTPLPAARETVRLVEALYGGASAR